MSSQRAGQGASTTRTARDAECTRPHHPPRRLAAERAAELEGEIKSPTSASPGRNAAREVTELGVIKGKYAYMSPEQLGGGKLDARSDIFSAGTLLYETLAGRNPFQEGSTYDTLQRIREGNITPIEEAVPGLPEEIGRIVRRAMAYAADDRYASAGDLYEDLIQYLYSAGKRVSARDLGEHLSSMRAAGEEGARPTDRFEAVFEVTAFDEPLPDRTRVERGRKPARRDAAATTTSSAGKRERTEWRDVTTLAIGSADEPTRRDDRYAPGRALRRQLAADTEQPRRPARAGDRAVRAYDPGRSRRRPRCALRAQADASRYRGGRSRRRDDDGAVDLDRPRAARPRRWAGTRRRVPRVVDDRNGVARQDRRRPDPHRQRMRKDAALAFSFGARGPPSRGGPPASDRAQHQRSLRPIHRAPPRAALGG